MQISWVERRKRIAPALSTNCEDVCWVVWKREAAMFLFVGRTEWELEAEY